MIYYSICTLGHHFIYPYIHSSILSSIYLSHIYLSIHTFILPSMHLYVNPTVIRSFINPSIESAIQLHSIELSCIYISLELSINSSSYLYILPSICPSSHTYIPPSTYPSINSAIHPMIQQCNDVYIPPFINLLICFKDYNILEEDTTCTWSLLLTFVFHCDYHNMWHCNYSIIHNVYISNESH